MENMLLKEALKNLHLTGNSLKENYMMLSDCSDVDGVLLGALNCAPFDILNSTFTGVLRNIIPDETAKQYCVFPVEIYDSKLVLAIPDPTDFETIEILRLLTGKMIHPVIASKSEIREAINKYYSRETQQRNTNEPAGMGETTRHRVLTFPGNDRSPVIQLVNQIVANALNRSASDIHFEPEEDGLGVRYRIDGVLQEVSKIALSKAPEIISRIKIMANLDIAEKRRPQDGRIRLSEKEEGIDIRVSTLPVSGGEKVVLRLLDRSRVALDLEGLGFGFEKLKVFKSGIKKPYGLILLTGPTGSGKTTTLYSALNYIKSTEINISTVEDPIEYRLDGINQTQVRPEIGLTFAKTLRTLLRQDPNVIMIGEIRDKETAEIAIRSALTGHLVLSTLHTNDSCSAITRLVDMGIEPFLITSSLNLVIAQRLIRRVCEKCKEEHSFTPENAQELGFGKNPGTFFQGKGCSECSFTGYNGRIGLFELLNVSDSIKNAISRQCTNHNLFSIARSEGLISLREDGIAKLKAGITTPSEIIRETENL